ncbi:glycosyltransferase [Paenibacillus sp. RC67]|uniref:glycosyltransferase n=1 Tax=Paenibacillus sp. RC67 TaxID=3039392 RepID=UPI0024ADDDBD|nr:glycosyltransferase [Paenibacillus sp. RC67]
MRALNSKLTLSMIVRNESERYLPRVLASLKHMIDEAVIIDDGSTDNTVNMVRDTLSGLPLRLVENQQSTFSNEVILRRQQWEETIQTNPSWILNLDADEMFEDNFHEQLDDILKQQEHDAIYFRLYDMWNEKQYRSDSYWYAHQNYRPFLIRYREDMETKWRDTPQHCGRFPESINQLSYTCHSARIKHYGWARAEDRLAKYKRYMELDPDARYGWKEQYDSILDPSPTLVSWEDV